MYCPKCGAQNVDGARFCKSCGAPLASSTKVAQAPMGGGGRPGKRRRTGLYVGLGVVIGVACVLLVLLLTGTLAREAALASIRSANGGELPEMDYGDDGTLHAIRGTFTRASVKDESSARDAIAEVAPLFEPAIPVDDLELQGTDQGSDATLWRFATSGSDADASSSDGSGSSSSSTSQSDGGSQSGSSSSSSASSPTSQSDGSTRTVVYLYISNDQDNDDQHDGSSSDSRDRDDSTAPSQQIVVNPTPDDMDELTPQDLGDDTTDDGTPEPKDAVEDYTWAELAEISRLIAAADSDDAGLQIAESYHLTNADRTLDGTQAKSLTLSDGTQCSAQILGFRHDDLSDGSGKAGISWIFANAPYRHEWNPSGVTTGAWQGSELRSFMNGDLYQALPDDLRAVVEPASKPQLPSGNANLALQSSSDYLWALSACEIVGDIYVDVDYYEAAASSEGSQYQLFSDHGVTQGEMTFAPLAKTCDGTTCSWWLRSEFPNLADDAGGGTPQLVETVNGMTSVGVSGSEAEVPGVVPGFCLPGAGATADETEASTTTTDTEPTTQDQATGDDSSTDTPSTDASSDGWYGSSLTGSASTTGASVTSATFSGGTWTLSGTFDYADTDQQLEENLVNSTPDRRGPLTLMLPVADDATFVGRGGDMPDQAMSRQDMEDIIGSMNGLGLTVHVQGGKVTYARISS